MIDEHGGRADGAARLKYSFLPAEAEVVNRRKKLTIFSRDRCGLNKGSRGHAS